MKRSVLVPMAMAAGILLSACGGSGDTNQVTNTIRSFLSDSANGDGSAACGLLTQSQAQQYIKAAAGLGPTTCVQVIQYLARTNPNPRARAEKQARQTAVVKVRVNGTTATARVYGRKVQLTKAGGRWLLSGGALHI